MVNTKQQYGLLFSIIVFGTVCVDQLLKYIVNSRRLDFGNDLIRIHFVKNTGAGFGILQNQTVLLAIISFIVTVLLISQYKKIPQERFPQIIFGLFLGGVMGNFIDRLLRGYVIDFIDISFWPVFNIADASITVAVIGILVYYWHRK